MAREKLNDDIPLIPLTHVKFSNNKMNPCSVKTNSLSQIKLNNGLFLEQYATIYSKLDVTKVNQLFRFDHPNIQKATKLIFESENTTCGLVFDLMSKGSLGDLGVTPSYLEYPAPEVIEFREQSDAADVYSFGMSLYVCVNKGRRSPFVTDSRDERTVLSSKQDFIRAGNRITIPIDEMFADMRIRERLQALIEKCWAEIPEDRPSRRRFWLKSVKYNMITLTS